MCIRDRDYPDDTELLEDVIIENKQAIEMSNIYRDILSGTMDALASVISNNLNIVMKVLAAVTIILTIPSIIFGLWGSNVPVPFESSPYVFFAIIGIAALDVYKRQASAGRGPRCPAGCGTGAVRFGFGAARAGAGRGRCV